MAILLDRGAPRLSLRPGAFPGTCPECRTACRAQFPRALLAPSGSAGSHSGTQDIVPEPAPEKVVGVCDD